MASELESPSGNTIFKSITLLLLSTRRDDESELGNGDSQHPPSESVYVHFFLFLLKATGAGLRRETRACRVSVMCQDMSGPRLCLRVVYALRRGHDDSCTSSSSRETLMSITNIHFICVTTLKSQTSHSKCVCLVWPMYHIFLDNRRSHRILIGPEAQAFPREIMRPLTSSTLRRHLYAARLAHMIKIDP